MAWALSAACVALLVRNPWYLLLIGGMALGVRWRAAGEKPAPALLRLFAGLMIFPTVLNFAFSRAGNTVLLEFALPVVGGPYTLEALLFGLAAGIQLASLLMVMMTFSALVTPSDMLRRMPAGLAPAGITASIAMNFAPQARASFSALREAQAVRGHQAKGWRDLSSLVTPLVILSLESAMNVGEGLATRGWGAGAGGRARWATAAAVALLVLGALVWLLVPRGTTLGVVVALLSASLLVVTLARSGTYSHYRPEAWRRVDTLVTGVALATLASILTLTLVAPGLLTYDPYPTATWPSLHLPVVLALLLLGVVAWIPNRD